MGRECLRYHSRLAELISVEKGEDYAKILTWIKGKVSFSILRSALLCLRGSRSNRRRTNNVKDIDVDVELARSNCFSLFQLAIRRFFFRGRKERLIQLLDYLPVASPELGLFSDWSRNKRHLELSHNWFPVWQCEV